MRADQLLVQRGLAASRSQAARLIESGARWQRAGQWRVLSKSDDVPDDVVIELTDDTEAKYVSRGGLKLEGALKVTGIDVRGQTCLDVGQSTGGFTDCLLQAGAAHVVGVDVGQGQLHPRLRADSRVTCIEKVNARSMDAMQLIASKIHSTGTTASIDMKFPLITGDLSFISLTLVLPAISTLLASQGNLLMLVKPQFELQPGQVGKRGIVRDPALYADVEQRIRDCCAALKLKVLRWFESPIQGGDGNREFFVHARKP